MSRGISNPIFTAVTASAFTLALHWHLTASQHLLVRQGAVIELGSEDFSEKDNCSNYPSSDIPTCVL